MILIPCAGHPQGRIVRPIVSASLVTVLYRAMQTTSIELGVIFLNIAPWLQQKTHQLGVFQFNTINTSEVGKCA